MLRRAATLLLAVATVEVGGATAAEAAEVRAEVAAEAAEVRAEVAAEVVEVRAEAAAVVVEARVGAAAEVPFLTAVIKTFHLRRGPFGLVPDGPFAFSTTRFFVRRRPHNSACPGVLYG
jgi:hypothetical protein